MKFLVFMLALSLAAPPVQAGFCEMDEDQNSMQHASMPHQANEKASHDCCESDDEEPGKTCDDAMQCGSCGIAAPAGLISMFNATIPQPGLKLAMRDDFLPPSHASPPFRPPIS